MAGFAEIFLRRNREEGWREEVTQARGCPFCGALSGEVHGIELQDGLLVVNSRSVRLTKTEAAIVGKLLKSFRKVVLKERLYNEIVSAKYTEADWPDKKIIDAYIHFLRRKLPKVGLKIETRYGFGYRLIEEAGDVEMAAE